MQRLGYLFFVVSIWAALSIDIVRVSASKGLSHSVRFINGSAKFDKETFAKLNSSVDSDGTINVDFEIVKTLQPGLRLAITMQYKLPDSNKYQTMLTYDLNTCKLLLESQENFMTRNWFRNALKFGNLPKRCPIKAGVYEVHNYRVDTENIPTYLPSGDYRVHELFYYGIPKAKNRTFVALLTQDVRFASIKLV